MDYEQVLAHLCALPGPSGFEEPVARAAADFLMPLVDQVWTNRLGSVIGVRRCGKEGARKLVLDAHLDEVGLIVTGHEDGFLRFATLGGVDPRMLPDREVLVLTQPPVPGVVACLPPHVQTREEMDQAQPVEELYVDVGLSQQEAQARIPVGTPIVCRGGCSALGEDRLCGKAMDDRACFGVLLDTMERLKDQKLDVDVYVLASTQEETSSAGAITAVYGIAPDFCVAVDVTHGDSPDASKDKTFPLGEGPVIGVGPNCARWMSRRFFRKAEELELPCQTEGMAGHSGTNAWPMQISREGVATAVLSLPLRYMHTPIEVVSRKDLENTAALLAAFVQDLGKEAPGNA